MAELVSQVRIARYHQASGPEAFDDLVVNEKPCTIYLNGEELVTLLCSPEGLRELAVGFLAGEGFINSLSDIKSIDFVEDTSQVFIELVGKKEIVHKTFLRRYLTTGCGKGVSFYNFSDARLCRQVEGELKITPKEILDMMRRLQDESNLHKETGGVHSAALGHNGVVVLKKEDIGRHNAIDKIFGHCLLRGISLEDKVLLVSGRVSSEIILKVIKMGIQILISRSAPTDLAVSFAQDYGVTLIGFARGHRFNVYSCPERVLFEL